MKKTDSKLYENIWIIRITSLLISLLLFGYVYSENYGLTTSSSNSSISTLRSETISNLPIEVNIDTNRFFIAGLPETVTLSLSGPESVIVQTLSAGDYTVVTEDLNQLGTGRHTIRLYVENLSDELQYQLTPSRVNVVIEEKVTVESPVEVIFDTSLVDDRYTSGKPVVNPEKVILTGPASTMDRVDRVYVRVPVENGLTSDVSGSSVVQVEDADRNKLNVTVEPQEVNVRIPIQPYEKTVPLKLKQTGTPAEGRRYELQLVGDGEITLTGSKSLLADVEQVEIPVDVSEIKTSTVLTVPVPISLPGVTIDPQQVQVNVTVENRSDSNNGSSSAALQNLEEQEAGASVTTTAGREETKAE